jgi:hypothetical protein
MFPILENEHPRSRCQLDWLLLKEIKEGSVPGQNVSELWRVEVQVQGSSRPKVWGRSSSWFTDDFILTLT